ncbi:MAG TPA: hypothetical protein VLX92_26090 [Kofleriaceae bacterium]|nr:hypothetical protein [Kofleriaceae bacterium]
MKIWSLLICLGAGCMSAAELRANDVAAAPAEASLLVYFKDARTGLCFAGRWFASNGAVLTNVPCSDAVERVIAGEGVAPAR